MTTPSAAPTSSASAPSSICTSPPGATSAWRGLTARTTLFGAPWYGAAATASPSMASERRWLSSVAYTVPLKRNGATSIRGPTHSANGDDTAIRGAVAMRSGERRDADDPTVRPEDEDGVDEQPADERDRVVGGARRCCGDLVRL